MIDPLTSNTNVPFCHVAVVENLLLFFVLYLFRFDVSDSVRMHTGKWRASQENEMFFVFFSRFLLIIFFFFGATFCTHFVKYERDWEIVFIWPSNIARLYILLQASFRQVNQWKCTIFLVSLQSKLHFYFAYIWPHKSAVCHLHSYSFSSTKISSLKILRIENFIPK